MIAYIPCPEEATPFLNVISSLVEQDDIEDYVIVRHGKVYKDPEKKRVVVGETYRKIFELAKKEDDDFFVINNSGQRHKKTGGIRKMKEALMTNPSWCAAALEGRDYNPRQKIRFECIMFWTPAVKDVKLIPHIPNKCPCVSIMKSFTKQGWRAGYVEKENNHLEDLGRGFHEWPTEDIST